MEGELSASLMTDEEVGIQKCGQTGLLKGRNASAYCQDLNKAEVGEKCMKGLDQCINKYTSPTFSDPLEEKSIDKDCASTINVEQRRVSRRDKHEHTLHSYGQSGDGLANNKSDIDDNLALPSKTEV